MKTIWKFPLIIAPRQRVIMPKHPTILAVQVQLDVPCVWAAVSSNHVEVPYHFTIVGTGNEIPEDAGTYIGTFQTHGGSFVWHLYGLDVLRDSGSDE